MKHSVQRLRRTLSLHELCEGIKTSKKELAGHSSDVYRQYTHHSLSSLRDAVEAMPTIN